MTRRKPGQVRLKQRVREVYFVFAEESGLIKIGVANDTARRMRALRTQCPEPISLVGIMICGSFGKLETWLHLRFGEFRERGEWFRPEPELLDFMEQHLLDPKTAEETKRHEQARKGRPSYGLPWVMPVPPITITGVPPSPGLNQTLAPPIP